MLCPRCGTNQSDEMKFCKVCGANLQAVRQALEHPEAGKAPDWGDARLAELMRAQQAAELHKLELERQRGLTPAVKRYNEIKAGVITSFAGIGVALFLAVFMQGLIGNVSPQAAEILSRVWIAGVIPIFIGIALIVNGLVVSKRMAEIQEREMKRPGALDGEKVNQPSLRPADTSEFVPTGFSVTEQTTRHLTGAERNPKD